MGERNNPLNWPTFHPGIISLLQILFEPFKLLHDNILTVFQRVVKLICEEDKVSSAPVVTPPEVVHLRAVLAVHAETGIVGAVIVVDLMIAGHNLVRPIARDGLNLPKEGVADIAVLVL